MTSSASFSARAAGADGIEDKFAIGTLDMLLVTEQHTHLRRGQDPQGYRHACRPRSRSGAIRRFNAVGNPRARALVIGYRDGHIGFGLPGTRWDAKYTVRWPITNGRRSHAHGMCSTRPCAFASPLSKETA